jgi:hypothetical protein
MAELTLLSPQIRRACSKGFPAPCMNDEDKKRASSSQQRELIKM